MWGGGRGECIVIEGVWRKSWQRVFREVVEVRPEWQ